MTTHDLIIVTESGPSHHREVVRWCRKCGAIVVDLDFDNRTKPGHYMKMRIPQLNTNNFCRPVQG